MIRASTLAFCAVCVSTPALAAPERAPRLDVILDLTTEYDTNIVRANDVVGTQRGLERDDVRFTPSITVEIARPIGPHSITATASAGYDLHARNTQLNRERLGFEGLAALDFGLCGADVLANYTRRQSDLNQIIVQSGQAQDDLRNAESIIDGNVRVSCGRQTGIRPYVNLGYRDGENSADLRKTSDFETLRYGGGLSYTNPLIGIVSLFVNRSDTEFPNRPAPRNRGYVTTSYGARFERDIGARLRGSVELSYTNVDSQFAGIDDFSGLNWAGELTARVGPQLQLRAIVRRETQSSLAVDSSYDIASTYGLDGTYALSQRLSLRAGYTHLTEDYFGSTARFGPTLTDERRNNFFVTAIYARTPRMRFSLTAGHETRRANDPYYDYNNTRVALSIARTF